MLKWLGSLIDSNEKEIRRLEPIVDQINALEPEFQKLSDSELHAKTGELKTRLGNGETLDDIRNFGKTLPEIYAEAEALRKAREKADREGDLAVRLAGCLDRSEAAIFQAGTAARAVGRTDHGLVTAPELVPFHDAGRQNQMQIRRIDIAVCDHRLGGEGGERCGQACLARAALAADDHDLLRHGVMSAW